MKRIITLLGCLLMLGTGCRAEERILKSEEIPAITESEAAGMVELGILCGTPEGLELERTVTRAEALSFIWRTTGIAFNDIGYLKPSFDDIAGHWAYDTIEKFYHAGYIAGVSDTEFAPDDSVTAKQFARIMLTVMGYEGVTIENVYEKSKECELILNNHTKSIIYNDEPLTRGDAVRLCRYALTAKIPEGGMLYHKLIEQGMYVPEDFEGILFVGCGVPAASASPEFADKLNALMPTDKNYMFSPLSIKMAFALAANGAEGETKEEILAAMGVDDLDEYNKAAKALIEKYQKCDVLKLEIANSIWLNSSRTIWQFNDTYKTALSEFYQAEADTVSDDDAVEKINSWVSDKTHGKITGIISEPEFAAMLVNAVYFNGAWVNEFNEGATKPDEFTQRDGEIKQIDFMNKTLYADYYSDGNVRIVELPYKNYAYKTDENGEYIGTERFDDIDVSMYVADGDCSNLESILNEAEPESTYIRLSMPKFESEFQVSLKEIMKILGVNKAFDENLADFSKMITGDRHFLTDAVHKTYIKVDEKGTEAAAVTGMMAGGTSMPPEPVEVCFNKPFIYVIRDNVNGEILFMGEFAYAE